LGKRAAAFLDRVERRKQKKAVEIEQVTDEQYGRRGSSA
jgi:hypothetical protein